MGKRTLSLALAASLLSLAGLVSAGNVPVRAAPVCAAEPREICGGRIFPEAAMSVSFLQYDNAEYADGIQALEEEFPRFVKARTFSQLLDKEVLSAGGREIWMIEITDFDALEANKVPVAVSLSVHGPERAGIEGGVRYAEDLARWATDDPDHELRNGTEEDSVGMPVSEVLKKVHLYLSNMNADGWAAGDAANGGAFMRGNANGYDLNRQFPTKGWTKVLYEPETQPETNAWIDLMRSIKPATASDLHGELTSANNVYADIMYPAGEWNPLEQAQVERLARHMMSNVTRYFESNGIDAGDLMGNAGARPAEYATAYDVVGYDDSGFMGDFFSEDIGAIEVDVEHLFSHMVPNSTWVAPHEEAHIAAVRGEIETLMIEALEGPDVEVSLDLGKVGYLFDPRRVKSSDGYGGPKPPKKVDPLPYNVSRMEYLEDLSRFATQPLKPIESRDVSASALRGLDTFVVAGRPFPRDPSDGKKPRKPRVIAALTSFVKDGGNLVLTDAGLKMLSSGWMSSHEIPSGVTSSMPDISTSRTSRTITSREYTRPRARPTTRFPLGYSVDQDASPHYTVGRPAWEEAGGKSIAYITDTNRIGLGRIDLGKGTIGIFGAHTSGPDRRVRSLLRPSQLCSNSRRRPDPKQHADFLIEAA